jgi:hypothetical protein
MAQDKPHAPETGVKAGLAAKRALTSSPAPNVTTSMPFPDKKRRTAEVPKCAIPMKAKYVD